MIVVFPGHIHLLFEKKYLHIQGFVQKMSHKRGNLYTNQEKIGSILHFKNGVTYHMPSVPKRGAIRHNIRTMPY